jgi:glycosyltransferase involved in cell wall biosynthesis
VGYRKLSVIVPVYNELGTVAEAVQRARSVDLPVERELIVVDDGSTDGTREILPGLADSKVRVLFHPANRGKTAAIRTALAHATGDLVLIQDADLEYDPEDWSKLLAPVLDGSARVVYGSRFTGRRSNMLLWSELGNRFLCLVTNVLYGSRLSDVETCYKLFDRQVLQSITLRSERFGFEPEVTAKLLRAGEPILEVPISYEGRTRQEGKKISWRDGLETLRILLACRMVRRRRPASSGSWRT